MRRPTYNPTRRTLLQRALLGIGSVALMSDNALAQAAKAKGHIVSATEALNWDMSPGRTVSHKLMSEHTGDLLSIFEETAPIGAGTPLHIHRTSDEVIHLIEGQLTVKLGDEVKTIGPGTWIFIPRGTTHGWRNTGTVAARASYTFTPSDGAKFFEESRLLGPMGPVNMEQTIALMKRYGYELVALTWK